MTSHVPALPLKSEYHEYYQQYVSLVKHSNILTAFLAQLDDTMSLLHTISASQALHRYAPGKWSIKEVMSHITDTERVFTYRALSFARSDESSLPSFDQDLWIKTCGADARTWGSLKEEYELARRSTIAMFSSFDAAAWSRSGVASDRTFTVRALAYITAGHELHHTNIIRDRYLGHVDVE